MDKWGKVIVYRVLTMALVVLLTTSGLAHARQASDSAAPGVSTEPDMTPQERYDALFQQMLGEPLNLDVMFRFARTAAQIGKTEAAISTLERMLLINPDLPRVKLELGALYYRVGSYQAARGYFEEVERETSLPPQVRERVKRYLARIENQDTRHTIRFSSFSGIRHQSNANSAPDGEDVLALGFPAQLDDEFQDQSDTSLFTSNFLRHSYDLQTGLDESWDTTLLGYASRQRELSRLDLDVVEATTGPTLTVLPVELDGATVRPYGTVSHVRLRRDELYSSAGAGIEGSVLLGRRAALNGSYELVYRDYENAHGHPTAETASGPVHDLALTGRYAATGNLTLLAGVGGTVRDADEDFDSFAEAFVRGGGEYRYLDPAFGTRFPWRVRLTVRRTVSDYDAPDPGVDPNRARYDKEWRITVGHSARITDFASLELQAQWTKHKSNLPNFEYDNLSVLGGISLDF